MSEYVIEEVYLNIIKHYLKAFAAAATGATFESTDVRGIRRRTTARLLMVATLLGGFFLSKI